MMHLITKGISGSMTDDGSNSIVGKVNSAGGQAEFQITNNSTEAWSGSDINTNLIAAGWAHVCLHTNRYK